MKKYRYLTALLLTSTLFGGTYFISSKINTARVENVSTMQENMAIDILSLETQFDLLQERSCADVKEGSSLSNELSHIQSRLAFTEAQLGSSNERVMRLKRQYSLLQIKDMLLVNRIAQKCNIKPVVVLYFYSNKDGVCDDCQKQGYVLTALRQKNPNLRVYSFDYDLDLPTIGTLASISGVTHAMQLPVLVIHNTPYAGYRSVTDVESILEPKTSSLKN
jgi:hypothetical protein